jgi:glycosyltransferase involved in cell wall biosynthesis
VEQQNTGRGGARNIALQNANGEYIAFLDSDDLLINSSIEERVNFLENNKDIGWVFTDAMEFDETGDLKLFLDQFPWLNLKEDNFSQLLKGCFPLTSTVMIRNLLLKQVGGFNSTLNYGEDIELFLRLLLISKVGMIREALTRRRIHPGQAVSSTFDRWNSRVKIYSNFKPPVGQLSQQQKSALYKALKHSYFKLGECYWEVYDSSKARRCFLHSIGFNSWTKRSILYLVLLFFPTFLLKIARNLKSA